MPDDEALAIEGLAAQLYAASRPDGYVWWHLLRDEIKAEFRVKAQQKVSAFAAEFGVTLITP